MMDPPYKFYSSFFFLDSSFYDKDSPLYTLPRNLPPSLVTDAVITDGVIGDGCILNVSNYYLTKISTSKYLHIPEAKIAQKYTRRH